MNVNQHSACAPLLYGALGKNTRDFLLGPILRRFDGKSSSDQETFAGQASITINYAAWGDLDNDGALDIVYGTDKEGLRVYYGPFTSLDINPKELSQYVSWTRHGR